MTDMIFSKDGEEYFRVPSPFSHNHYVVTKCPETKLEVKKMTIRAQELIDASMQFTLRPKSEDRGKLIAFILREAADRLCTNVGELQDPIIVLREFADEFHKVNEDT